MFNNKKLTSLPMEPCDNSKHHVNYVGATYDRSVINNAIPNLLLHTCCHAVCTFLLIYLHVKHGTHDPFNRIRQVRYDFVVSDTSIRTIRLIAILDKMYGHGGHLENAPFHWC